MANNSISSMDTILNLYRCPQQDNNFPANLKCVICKYLLLDPVQTSCGCRYCRSCIDHYLHNNGRTCLGDFEECKTIIDGYIPDKATARDIGQLTVPCLNLPCLFKDTLKNMSTHLKTCEYRKIICEQCQLSYLVTEKLTHDENECLMRKKQCPHCNNSFPFKELNEIHLNLTSDQLCTKYNAECPNKCEVKGELCLVTHLKTCKNRPQQCPFSLLGCDEVIPREKLPEHVISHSSIIVQSIQSLQKEVNELRDKISTLETENQKAELKMESMKCDFDRKFSSVERIHKDNNQRSGNKLESIFNKGKYIWKINNFSVKKDNAQKGVNSAIVSDPFYTDEFGYKMCLKIYPFGDGIAKGTHLSVFFVLMKGEYDDLQSWPFRNKVTLTILDDFSKSTNHSDTFKPDARSICYQRPEEEYNIASGSPKFISFVDLSKFLKQDTLYLQISVLPL